MIDIDRLFYEVLGEKREQLDLPPPSFQIMKCEIVKFDLDAKSITVKMPVLRLTLNPFGTMQGGMIVAALDNALGPLSMLIAPFNMTRKMNTTYIRPIKEDLKYIYVLSRLTQRKGRRLFFETHIEDASGKLYAKATTENWIIGKGEVTSPDMMIVPGKR